MRLLGSSTSGPPPFSDFRTRAAHNVKSEVAENILLARRLENWLRELRYEPIAPLTASKNQAINFFAKRDFLNERSEAVEVLWKLPQPMKIIRRQQLNGSWKYPGGGKQQIRSSEDYDQI